MDKENQETHTESSAPVIGAADGLVIFSTAGVNVSSMVGKVTDGSVVLVADPSDIAYRALAAHKEKSNKKNKP